MPRIDNSHSAPGSGTSSQVEAEYPERFRVRLAGRIDQVWIPAVHDKPLYQAELIVAKSKPLQWASPLALIGMPIVEPPGEDFDDEQEDSLTSAVFSGRKSNPYLARAACSSWFTGGVPAAMLWGYLNAHVPARDVQPSIRDCSPILLRKGSSTWLILHMTLSI